MGKLPSELRGCGGACRSQAALPLDTPFWHSPFEIFHFPLCLIHVHTVQVDIFRQKDIICEMKEASPIVRAGILTEQNFDFIKLQQLHKLKLAGGSSPEWRHN